MIRFKMESAKALPPQSFIPAFGNELGADNGGRVPAINIINLRVE